MNKDTSRSTILVISMGFLAMNLLFAWHWAAIVSLIVGLIGIVSSQVSRKIEWLWMKLAKFLSYLIPSIVLGLIFYLILFPFSLLAKLFVKDPLMLSRNYGSYFLDCNRNFDKRSMEKIW